MDSGMSRTQFKNNLVQAIESKDCYVDDKTIEEFLDLNYCEETSNWDFQDFNNFACEICSEWGNLWKVAREFDLKIPISKE
jgi:hypothetical protein